jgi:diguanylate cyclase (GGDEF)-like protein
VISVERRKRRHRIRRRFIYLWLGTLVLIAGTVTVVAVGNSDGQVSSQYRPVVAGLVGFLAAVPVLTLVFLAIRERERRALRARVDRLEREALTDGLTGAGNRRAFAAELNREAARGARHGTSLALSFLDIDWFKGINDRWGHEEGDRVLAAVAQLVNSVTRAGDTLFRIGGDEFALMLPGISLDEAKRCLDRIREVAAVELPRGATISAGVAALSTGIEAPSALCRDADLALYEAKRRGRNLVVGSDELDTQVILGEEGGLPGPALAIAPLRAG